MTPAQLLIEMNASLADSGRKLAQMRFDSGAIRRTIVRTLVFVAVVVLAAWRVNS